MSMIHQTENQMVIGEYNDQSSGVDMMEQLLTERMELLRELDDPTLMECDKKWIEQDIEIINQKITAFQKLY
jgi:hypothetical protein